MGSWRKRRGGMDWMDGSQRRPRPLRRGTARGRTMERTEDEGKGKTAARLGWRSIVKGETGREEESWTSRSLARRPGREIDGKESRKEVS